jgi:ABC-type amino acid transport substrate-binding protein
MRAAVAILLALLGAAPACAAEPPPWRVVVAGPDRPEGLTLALPALELVLRRAGLTYAIGREPIERAQVSFKAGLYDIDGARAADFDRLVPGAIRVDPPLLTIPVKAFGIEPLPGAGGWAALERYRVARVRGQRAVESRLPQADEVVSSVEACARMASAGRVDYCVLAVIGELSVTDLRAPLQATLVAVAPLHLWVRPGPGREALARRLADSLRAVSASGELAQALQAWREP